MLDSTPILLRPTKRTLPCSGSPSSEPRARRRPSSTTSPLSWSMSSTISTLPSFSASSSTSVSMSRSSSASTSLAATGPTSSAMQRSVPLPHFSHLSFSSPVSTSQTQTSFPQYLFAQRSSPPSMSSPKPALSRRGSDSSTAPDLSDDDEDSEEEDEAEVSEGEEEELPVFLSRTTSGFARASLVSLPSALGKQDVDEKRRAEVALVGREGLSV
ncbi:hypothetical protein P7C70_g7934, partial [Phenoliferia sp. Uapishka_3]